MAQLGDNEIMIIGGFCDKYMNNSYTIKFDDNGCPTDMKSEINVCKKHDKWKKEYIFPFQVPTIRIKKERAVLTVDWNTMKMFCYKDKWSYVQYFKD